MGNSARRLGATKVPDDVAAIRGRIESFLNKTDAQDRKIGDAQCGIYVFYDYDGEPIYVGQTMESLRARIGRHLTNQRTDPVAMNVLDPFEVAEIGVWPLFELKLLAGKSRIARQSREIAKAFLKKAEYTVYRQAIDGSKFKAVLNEKDIPRTSVVRLPRPFRDRIIPDELFLSRKHPDVRIARRASTIANLAKVISERKVSKGLRRTLRTQALRLLSLVETRLNEFTGGFPIEEAGEETGESTEEQ